LRVAAERTFGRELVRGIIERKPRQNVFISPLSVFLALHMAENGAGGDTRTAMRKTLALPDLDAAGLNASTAALLAGLKSRNPDALNIANALWADRRFTLDPEYVKLCTTLFGASAATLDFRDARAAAEINDWVKGETKGKIGNIVTADAVAKAAVILTNAVYFAASWRTEFSPSQTQTAGFHLTGGGEKSVPMMHQPRIAGAYRAGGNFEGALLQYKQSSIFLYALLPREGENACRGVGVAGPGAPDRWRGGFRPGRENSALQSGFFPRAWRSIWRRWGWAWRSIIPGRISGRWDRVNSSSAT
jgi:serine protease inhibitor